MSSALEILNEHIDAKHLLKHPFYVAWSKGELTLEDLRFYAQRYFAHVRAFPAYLSETHSRCSDLQTRHIIAANLADEEGHAPTHPDLWLDFAAGLGASKQEVLNAPVAPKMQAMIDAFTTAARMDTGLAAAALYCYEKQIPQVAGAKISGLEEKYGITDADTLRYFRVHEEADVEHAAQWETIIAGSNNSPEAVAQVADQVLTALWDGLSEIYDGCSRPAGASAMVC